MKLKEQWIKKNNDPYTYVSGSHAFMHEGLFMFKLCLVFENILNYSLFKKFCIMFISFLVQLPLRTSSFLNKLLLACQKRS